MLSTDERIDYYQNTIVSYIFTSLTTLYNKIKMTSTIPVKPNTN